MNSVNSSATTQVMLRLIAVAAMAVVAALAVAAPAVAQVEGRITRVGLFAGGEPLLRSGAWSFVEVELRYRGVTPFGGALHTEQRDRDGDVVESILPVALEPNGEWRPYQLYYVPYDVNAGDSLRVTLYDDKDEIVRLVADTGEEVPELIAPQAMDLRSDDLLIVDLTSPGKLPHLALLDMYRRGEVERINRRRVRAMAPRELPSRWQGLEAVDVIVWDDADPSTLSPQQIQALVDWVRTGGRLLVTAGRNWRMLAESPLADALPVRITGAEERKEAQEFLDIIANEPYAGRLDRAYARKPIMRCLMTPLPESLPLPTTCPNPQICYRRMLGSGMLTILGASLKQLLPVPKRLAEAAKSGDAIAEGDQQDDPFIDIACEQVIARRLLALPPVIRDEGGITSQYADLFQTVRGSIAFESVGTKFLIFAILFAAVYTATATIGSYLYLKRRGWLHHCWTAFGAISIAGSVIGTGMVGMLRGITRSVWQTSIIDIRANSDEASAECLFGVKTPNHTRLNIALPVGEPGIDGEKQFGPIRAMPGSQGFEMQDSRFAASSSYESLLAGDRLAEVPVRATLKEFQGNWHGRLSGRVEGKLVLRRPTEAESQVRYEFGPGSFLRNGLGTDLKDCYLLITQEEVAGDRVSVLANCFFLGDLPSSGADAELSDTLLRKRLLYRKPAADDADQLPKPIATLPLLSKVLQDWTGRLQSILPMSGTLQTGRVRLTSGADYPAILMLSMFDTIREDTSNSVTFRRGHGRRLGCTFRLTRQTALLVGRSEDAPPALLEINDETQEPDRSNTIYRIVIPVEGL